MQTTELLAAIDGEISRLQQARNLLGGHETGNGRIKTKPGPKPKALASGETGNGAVIRKRVLSPEARKKIADAQKKRWAKARKAVK
jgi:hypothetical protein